MKQIITVGTIFLALCLCGNAMATNFGLDINNPPETPPIFTFLQEEGGISPEEMYRTFNMGMGFLIITNPSVAEELAKEYGGRIVGDVTQEPGCRVGEMRLW